MLVPLLQDKLPTHQLLYKHVYSLAPGYTLFPFRLDLVGNEDAGIKVPEKIRVELSAPGNNKHYEEGEVPAPSYADQIPGVEQVQADEGVQYFVAVDTDGGISFKLRAGQKLTVKDLPAGVAYQFQETIPPGWMVSSTVRHPGMSARPRSTPFTRIPCWWAIL